jgi:hypothetical protein
MTNKREILTSDGKQPNVEVKTLCALIAHRVAKDYNLTQFPEKPLLQDPVCYWEQVCAEPRNNIKVREMGQKLLYLLQQQTLTNNVTTHPNS